MTVAELIEALKELPQDMAVYTWDEGFAHSLDRPPRVTRLGVCTEYGPWLDEPLGDEAVPGEFLAVTL